MVSVIIKHSICPQALQVIGNSLQFNNTQTVPYILSQHANFNTWRNTHTHVCMEVVSQTSVFSESKSACVLLKATTSAPHWAKALTTARPMPVDETHFNHNLFISTATIRIMSPEFTPLSFYATDTFSGSSNESSLSAKIIAHPFHSMQLWRSFPHVWVFQSRGMDGWKIHVRADLSSLTHLAWDSRIWRENYTFAIAHAHTHLLRDLTHPEPDICTACQTVEAC